MLPPEWGWLALPDGGWNLLDLPERLNHVGLVIWVITPHHEDSAGRDGRENSALSVIAGYCEAQPEIDLRVLQAKNARVVVDVVSAQTEFSTPNDFLKRLTSIKTEWDAKRAPRLLGAPASAAAVERPKIEPLPWDDWSSIPDRFIGRQLQLNDAADAIEGLLHRAKTGEEPERGRGVKLIWVHGLGGMGKSWFLHRTRLQAGPEVRTLIVDWDSPQWRYPLSGEPRFVGDLCEPIAYRLVQTCGEAAADQYWLAKARVRAASARHQQLRDQFDSELTKVAGPDRPSATIKQLLDGESVWDDDVAKRARKLEAWQRDPERYRISFLAWCHETARDADAAVIDPDGELVGGLRDALRAAARGKPLILLLDTGEVLSAELDRWLRRLLVPICRDESPALILIGSRLVPDVALSSGSREGWQTEIPRERFRPILIDELFRFSVEEIDAALNTPKQPSVGEAGELAERIHKITRGMPLAVRALLDFREEGIDESILDDISEAQDDEPLQEAAAVRKVVGKVADRLLYHLDPKRRPEREDDLRAIIALAILQRADAEVLKRLWPGDQFRSRLLDLGSRYALLSGGDLHGTVRQYLRRHWRDEGNRPVIFDDVLRTVERAIEALPSLSDRAENDESAARRVLRMNVQAWRQGDDSVPVIARALAVALAYDQGNEDLVALVKELPLAGEKFRIARKIWQRPGGGSAEENEVVAWLRTACNGSTRWDTRERACLALIEGVVTARWGMASQDALSALSLLKTALEEFTLDELPQKERVGEALGLIARALDPYWLKEKRCLPQAEEAYLLAIQQGANESRNWYNLGFLYEVDLERIDKAETAYLKAVELDPKFAAPHHVLGNLYQYHLERYADAETEYLKAIELNPKDAAPHHDLGNLYQDHLERRADAETEYLKAIELDPKDAAPHNALGNLYQYELDRYAGAATEYLKAIELDPCFAWPHDGLGNLYQYHLERCADAEKEYLKAIEVDPKYARPHVGLGYLYLDRLGRYEEAERAFLDAIRLDPKSGAGHRGLAWHCLLVKNDVRSAERFATTAVKLEPKHPLGSLALIAVATWAEGWEAVRSMWPEWLARCPGWYVAVSRFPLIAAIRKTREQGGLPELAEMIRSVADRPSWKPWSEAISMVATGNEPTESTSDKARPLYDRLK